MAVFISRSLAVALAVSLAACGGSSSDMTGSVSTSSFAGFEKNQPIVSFLGESSGASDKSCDNATYPSLEWTQCEATAFAKLSESTTEQLSNPAFQARLLAQSASNTSSLIARSVADPSWTLASSPALAGLLAGEQIPESISAELQGTLASLLGNPSQLLSLNLNTPATSITASYAGPAVGDPFRYPEASGPDGANFYINEATVTPVVFYDSDCARISGRIWRPKNVAAGTKLPGIVIDNGSVQAHEASYWWAAQSLVRSGYEVMTFDPRGQGRSDFTAPGGQLGTNAEPSVFWLGLVNAIDFFRSSPSKPYPNNDACSIAYPTKVTAFNPEHAVLDLDRLGLAGHSLGAIGVSVVQGYGAPGADPWPGKLDKTNPVDTVVAWDGLLQPDGGFVGGAAQGGGLGDLLGRAGILDPAFRLLIQRGLPKFGIRVPAMGQSSEYGLIFAPFLLPPDQEQRKALAFNQWKSAGVPVMEFTTLGSGHLEWSQFPLLPTTSWCPSTDSGSCRGGWAAPMLVHYTLAWFDRWLKKSGEQGFADADARLLNDAGEQGADKMSLRYRSARFFPDRDGRTHHCEDIRAGQCSGSTN